MYPEEGQFPRIARALLAAADSPSQVQVVSHPQMGFRVPQEVFERFHQTEQANWEQEDEVPAPELASPDATPLAQPRRRGRPRKNPLPEQKVEEQ